MATLRADRRLYLTADRSEVVEEGDPRGAWLLVAKGRNIGEGDVAKYRMSMSGGRVVYRSPEAKQAARPEDKMAAAPENKAAEPADDAEPDDVEEEWTLKTSPEDYLERHPDGPNAELAARILAARDESGNGDS